MPTFYGYARVSRVPSYLTPEEAKEKEKGDWNSIANQVERIKAKHQQLLRDHPDLVWGGDKKGRVYTDGAVSAGISFAERTQGRELDERLQEGDHLCLAKLDRGFRNTVDALMTVENWHRRGIVVHILNIGMDTSTPMGRCLVGFLASLAQFEREMARERTLEIMTAKRRNGEQLNHQAPLGFTWEGRKKTRWHTKGRWLVPDPAERAHMAEIVELHQAQRVARPESSKGVVETEYGLSFHDIYLIFLKKGYRTRQRMEKGVLKDRAWSTSRIERAYDAELQLREWESAGKTTEEIIRLLAKANGEKMKKYHRAKLQAQAAEMAEFRQWRNERRAESTEQRAKRREATTEKEAS